MDDKHLRNKLGKIHLYAGEGKGKTTAAVGLAIRAAGNGLNVLFMQFLKDGNSGEIRILKQIPNIQVINSNPVNKFVFTMNEQEKNETKSKMEASFLEVQNIVKKEEIDLLILDETLGAISTGMISESKTIEFLKGKPEHLEVVLTGRGPSKKLIELADYYSEIKAIKHPYETEKLLARQGIEF
ncbi:MAG: cob(I)yrinic acid a,c-diamide adenosyltransferase [Clostridiaceae bacterium]|nr:cob(I)yrinic acid a,c-diamide adenosyltransferase [Clostridiaceae bacterium]